MAGMGPPPKQQGQRARRNATLAMTRLPSEGRKGRAPSWPLLDDIEMSARHELTERRLAQARDDLDEARGTEKESRLESKVYRLEELAFILQRKLEVQRAQEQVLWKKLWSLPQAKQWDLSGWTREVAQYVRWKVLAELGDLDASKEARQLGDRLGLTPLAMLRLRWEVVSDEVGAKRDTKQDSGRGRYASLRVVGAASSNPG
ncbi:MAG: hypothetical protein JWP14_3390 [Frankiales bacterium]|nr:hypothetical protein [Frankiales bacterium]